MSTVPTGAPPWVRTTSHTHYGGNVNKENYAGEGSVDAQTDFNAAELCRMAADLEAVARVAEFATITYTQDDTGTNDPTVDDYDAMAGTAPTAVRESDGVVLLTWDDDYPDSYSVDGDIHFAHVDTALEGAVAGSVTWELVDVGTTGKNNAVRVYTWDAAGVAATDKTVTVTVSTSVG